MMSLDRYEYSFFGQEPPERPLLGLIAEHDLSEPYEVHQAAIFAVDPVGYLVVEISGCSCWPDRGWTDQTYCPDKAAVDRALTGDHRPLLQMCQDRDWAIEPPTD